MRLTIGQLSATRSLPMRRGFCVSVSDVPKASGALAAPSPANATSPEAYMIDQRAQDARRVTALRIVQVVAGEGRAVFLEHRNQLAARECIPHVRLVRQGDSDSRYDETT